MNPLNELIQFTNTEIDARFARLVKSERKITHLVLTHIAEVSRRKLYLDYGLTSVYQYLTQRHGYCESSAYVRMDAAKVFAANPHLHEKIEEGSIKLSQLAKVQRCVKQKLKAQKDSDFQKNQAGEQASDTDDTFDEGEVIFDNASLRTKTSELLARIENKTGFETDKILSVGFDVPVKALQKTAPQKDGTIRLEFSVSAEDFEAIQKLQSRVSHSVPNGDFRDFFMHLVHQKNRAFDGKAKSASVNIDTSGEVGLATTHGFSAEEENLRPSRARIQKGRSHVRLTTKRRLLEKARHCCEHIDETTGGRCRSQFQLQVDHVVPLALGGVDSEENMRILCAAHNRASAEAAGLRRPSSAAS